MVKIRLVHKGLILVAVPLIFGIGFISLLFSGLLETSKLLDREFILKDAIVSHFSTITAGACSGIAKAMFGGTGDPIWKEAQISQQKRAITSDKHLRKILRKEPSIFVPDLTVTFNSMLHHLGTTTPLLAKLQGMSKEQSKASIQSIESLRLLLYSGVTAGTILSLFLAIFFCLNITNRLLIIVNNALSLWQGRPLNPPFKGSDEIAELDQLLYKSATEIRELERFKKEMVGVVSHELKSPLSSVGGFLSAFHSGLYGELNAKAQDKADRTYKSVKRLMSLVAELLFLDRLELEMSPEHIKVDELISASVDTVKELSEKSGIKIEVFSEGGDVYADRNRLVQVIVNLLSNAMKFSPPNGTVILDAKTVDGFFQCRVSDQGRGIPESFRNQIFEPFKQVDASDATSKKGTGLGLTISRSIVEQHGGQIGVDSEEGKGSKFWFKLPQSKVEQSKNVPASTESLAALKTVQKSGSLQSGKFRVLHQGLVIIALPLIFQLGFALSFNSMLNGLCQQTEEEEKSMKVLTALNNATDCIAGATDTACAYAYLGLKQYSNSWHDAAARTRGYFEQAMTLTSSGKDQEKDLKRAMHYLDEMTKVYENEEKTHECRQLFDRLYYPYRKNFYKAFGVDPKPRTPEDIAADQERLDPYELRDSMSALFKDSIHKNNLHILKLKNILDRAMDREKMISARAAMQRLEMIDKLKFVLISAIVITVAISTFIALFLMRSISRRLQHIMQNTERLARREALDAPLNGYDEIALLDAVLFETGNRLMELETFKRELVSIVSRELRTPLLSISSALELFSTGMLGELTDKGKNRLKHAQLEADRLIRLINDLLDIEKMDAGKFVLDFSEHRVSDLLETSASAAAQLAEAKSISLEIRNQDADQVIFVDRDRLCQVFINLLSNAIKYSPENGSIVITAEKPEDGQIKFSIIDQGRGIPEELRQRIFDRFVQVEKADATERGGTGLGLAICKAIVDQHGGEIGVDSQMGVGSTFWFRIPIRPLNIIARVEEPKLLTTEV